MWEVKGSHKYLAIGLLTLLWKCTNTVEISIRGLVRQVALMWRIW